MNAGVLRLPGALSAAGFRWRPLIALTIVAAAIAWFFGRAAVTEIAEPARVSPATQRKVETPTPVSTQLALAARQVGKVTNDLFAQHSWYVAPPAPPPVKAGPPPAPVAPAFPYQFFGSYERLGDKAVFIMTQGDRTYDLHVGDVLDNTWSIDAAANGRMQVTYLPLKQSQSLAVGSTQ
jgi:hypothetical protein